MILEISIKRVSYINATTIQIEAAPADIGLADLVLHGSPPLPLNGRTIEQAIDDYLPIARAEILANLPAQFEGMFEYGTTNIKGIMIDDAVKV